MNQVIDELQKLQTSLESLRRELASRRLEEPATLATTLETLPAVIARVGAWDGEAEEGVQELRIHRDWCEKHSGDSDRDIGRFLGADVMWATFNAKILPSIRASRAA
ncbi:hypothetical protein [Zavarzinella formosa]|uniref:hypothetical protein n=1 Tax=Zavarzinella formosa TaxID=360055 RepID=UPI0002DFB01D|nr:hypothetical protein [Zavarzinella formosa]